MWDEPIQLEHARPFNLAGAYRRANRAFLNALEEDDDARRTLTQATRTLGPFIKSWKPTHTAHNDFYDDQMLELRDGRVVLVDFEKAGPGDPLLDVGNFLAHLRWGAHFGREREAEAKDAYRAIFRQAALERFGWDERELALRQAVCLFRICTNAIRHSQPAWRRRLKNGLSLVNEVLDS